MSVPDDISVGSHILSALQVRFCAAGAVLFFALFCTGVALSTRISWWRRPKSCKQEATASIKTHLKPPIAARLRPDTTLPQSPFTRRPHLTAIVAPPPAHTTGPISNIYRCSGEWLSGRKRSGPSQTANQSSQRRQGLVGGASSHRTCLPATFHWYKLADSVVGAHPNAWPFQQRSAVADSTNSFPWVGAGFKFGLVHTVNVKPTPAPPVVKACSSIHKDPSPTELYRWGTVTQTLAKPLRGNKLQRTPFAVSRKYNVTTNVVFPRTSPFCVASPEKENQHAFSSSEAVRALV